MKDNIVRWIDSFQGHSGWPVYDVLLGQGLVPMSGELNPLIQFHHPGTVVRTAFQTNASTMNRDRV